jgi:hypothetical protein
MQAPAVTKAHMNSLVWRRLGTRSSEENGHEIQTTSSLANIMFWTSMPGVTKNLYRSCGSEINLVCVRLIRSVSFPQMEFRVLTDRVLLNFN